MGFRFYKSVNFGAFRVNFSKSGVGYSVGVPGFRYTVMADRGERITVPVLGTGLSYVEEYQNTLAETDGELDEQGEVE